MRISQKWDLRTADRFLTSHIPSRKFTDSFQAVEFGTYWLVLVLFNNATQLPGGPRWHNGYGAVLQIGRSLVQFQMVSLKFFIDIILPITLMALGSTQPLTEMSTRRISWG